MKLFNLKNKDESPFKETFLNFEKINSGQKSYIRLRGKNSLIILRGKVCVGYTHEKIEFKAPKEKEGYLKVLMEKIIKKGYQKVKSISHERLFIQVQYPKEFENEEEQEFWELMDLRHDVEDMIDSALKNKALGECFASDMGFGANILLEVWDLNVSIQVIKNVLEKNNLLKNTLIIQQIEISQDNWENKVLYPKNYTGELHLY